MSESRNSRVAEFKDTEYRESYAEDYLHSFIAMQFRAVREQREMTQEELAQAIQTKQTAISRLESVNNRSRNLSFLQRAAFALGCRLRVSLETFGSLINDEGPQFSREMLLRPSFDEEFSDAASIAPVPIPKNNVISLQSAIAGPGLGGDSTQEEASVLKYSIEENGQTQTYRSGVEDKPIAKNPKGTAWLQTKMAQTN